MITRDDTTMDTERILPICRWLGEKSEDGQNCRCGKHARGKLNAALANGPGKNYPFNIKLT